MNGIRKPGSGAGGAAHLSLLTVRVEVTEDAVEIRLSLWERVLGLMRSISVPRSAVREVRLLENPMSETMRSGVLKVGLRLPWVIYVARSIRLDQAFVVRRGAPGLSFAVADHGLLRRVVVSTPRAAELVELLGSRAGVPAP